MVKTPEEKEANRRKACRDISNALWEGTNYLSRAEWESHIDMVLNEIISDWD